MVTSTIFGESAPTGANWNPNEGPVSLGTVIQVLAAGTVTHVRVPNNPDYQGRTLTMWVATEFWNSPIGGRQIATRVTASQRPSRQVTAADSGAWIEFALPAPVAVSVGQVIMAGVWVPTGAGYYSRGMGLQGGSIVSPVGTMQAMQSGTATGIDNASVNGRYSYDAEPYWPLDSYQAGLYFVDLRFDDGASGGGSFPVTGVVVSSSAVVGVVSARRPVAGKVSSVSTVTGNLTQGFTGRVGSSSLVSGRVTAQIPMVGVVATASTITGHMEPVGGLAGTITAVSSVTGKVTAARPVTGTSSTASTVTGRLDAAGGLTGRVTAATSVTGSVTARLMVGGTARSSSTVTGRLTARHAIYGAVLTVSAVTGEMIPGGLPPIPDTRLLQGARTQRILAGASNTRPLIGRAPTRRLEGTS